MIVRGSERHLEHREYPITCGRRKLHDETGLNTPDLFEHEELHYVALFVASETAGDPAVREQVRCGRWDWFRRSMLPAPLFAPRQRLHAQGYVPPGAF